MTAVKFTFYTKDMVDDITSYFIEAAKEIFSEIGFDRTTFNETGETPLPYEIVVNVGITGDLIGYLILKSSIDSANKLVSRMLDNMGMPDEEPDFGPFKKEAMGEILNQLSGRSTMKLSDDGIDCDITPPTIIKGENIFIDVSSLELIDSVLCESDFGKLEVFMALKKVK